MGSPCHTDRGDARSASHQHIDVRVPDHIFGGTFSQLQARKLERRLIWLMSCCPVGADDTFEKMGYAQML